MDDRHATRSFVVDAGPGLEPAVMLMPGVLDTCVLILPRDQLRLRDWKQITEVERGRPYVLPRVPDTVRVRKVSRAVWWKPWTWFDVSFEVEGLGRNA